MDKSSSPKLPRINPFWTYRDPLSGRWLTLMTAMQCDQLMQPVFTPKTRQTQPNPSTSSDT
jgi:hypothetical protein